MCAILVDVDALYILAIDVAAKLRTLVYHQAPLAMLAGEMGKGGPGKTGADDEVVIIFHTQDLSGINN